MSHAFSKSIQLKYYIVKIIASVNTSLITNIFFKEKFTKISGLYEIKFQNILNVRVVEFKLKQIPK